MQHTKYFCKDCANEASGAMASFSAALQFNLELQSFWKPWAVFVDQSNAMLLTSIQYCQPLDL